MCETSTPAGCPKEKGKFLQFRLIAQPRLWSVGAFAHHPMSPSRYGRANAWGLAVRSSSERILTIFSSLHSVARGDSVLWRTLAARFI
jgi:hypothetical protein